MHVNNVFAKNSKLQNILFLLEQKFACFSDVSKNYTKKYSTALGLNTSASDEAKNGMLGNFI